MCKVNIKFWVVSFFLLYGCATTNDLRNNPPDLDLTSIKKAKDVGVCIADSLETMSSAMDTMSARQTSNGYSVVVTQNMPGGIFGSGKDTIIVVDITDTQSGSRTLFFNHFLAGGRKFFEIMRDCQGKSPVNTVASPAIKESETQTQINVTAPQKIRELESLRKDGIITENEFQTKKKQLLEKF